MSRKLKGRDTLYEIVADGHEPEHYETRDGAMRSLAGFVRYFQRTYDVVDFPAELALRRLHAMRAAQLPSHSEIVVGDHVVELRVVKY